MENIPRRKIYEKMLEYEDILIDMQILLLNEDNFLNYKEKFNEGPYKLLFPIIQELKSLLILFLENKKYETREEYNKELEIYATNSNLTQNKLIGNPNLTDNFKNLLEDMEKNILIDKEISSIEDGKKIFTYLDKFNSYIPKLLELRRDNMKS